MKKKEIFCLCLSMLAFVGYSQTSVTQANGVVVYSAQGVEKSVKQETSTPTIRTIKDWSLSECIDAEPYIIIKLNEADNDQNKAYYNQQLEMLRARKNELMNITPETKNN